MMRLLILALVNASLLAAEPTSPPRDAKPPAGPKIISDLRCISLLPNGQPDQAGQTELDRMVEEGWRATSMSVVSAPGNQPIRMEVLFSRLVRPSVLKPTSPAVAAPKPMSASDHP